MDIVLASRNPKKSDELKLLLAGLPVTVRTLDEFPGVGEAVEDGRTFAENAVKKALHAARATGLAAIADDSGLEVEALNGAPGVRSARYAGEGASDGANNRKLLDSLRGRALRERRGRFRCVVALASPDGRVETAEGSCEGVILDSPRGDRGFGYDPVFFYPPLGRTFAELEPVEKHAVSHRGMALRAAADIIRRWIGERQGPVRK